VTLGCYWLNAARLSIMAVLVVMAAMPAAGGDAQRVFRIYNGDVRPNHRSRYMTATLTGGTDSKSGPSIGIDLWQGECRLDISLRNRLTRFDTAVCIPMGVTGEDTAVISCHGVTYRFYRANGGFEWEIILHSRPDTNVFVYDIAANDLIFFRQDSLTDFEKYSLGARRPDSVIGAYVAYHAGRSHDWHVVAGDDTTFFDYGTGQAFIVYRPRAWDSLDTVWCDLKIDKEAGLWEISVDAGWLGLAQYPVTIDPTFGNTSVGASTVDFNQVYAYCHCLTGTNTYTVLSGKTATVSGYAVYASETGAGDLPISMTAYRVIDGLPDRRAGEPAVVKVSGGTAAWFASSTVSHELETSAEYGVAIGCAPRSGGTIYYNSVDNAVATDNDNCPLDCEYWSPATRTLFNYSMYATYIEEDIATGPAGRRRLVMPEDVR
jgi:hypothetical protein